VTARARAGRAATDAVHVYRIGTDTPDYTAEDLSGVGASLHPGRWNTKGQPVVYTASSRALAALEVLVHLGVGDLPLNRYLVEIALPRRAWDARAVCDPAAQPGWDAQPPGRVSITWGASWLTRGVTLVAEVPSVVVPAEKNFLLNPSHPDSAALRVVSKQRFLFDHRLLRLSAK
jgi:RES domain-containing protein